ncbi:MAG: Fic family protein [Bdellovibrionales bacterium]|nr:Fic family protein [Bdellovibrionales bacterium]
MVAYLFHLVKNHAFNDGNKRIAALTAAVIKSFRIDHAERKNNTAMIKPIAISGHFEPLRATSPAAINTPTFKIMSFREQI